MLQILFLINLNAILIKLLAIFTIIQNRLLNCIFKLIYIPCNERLVKWSSILFSEFCISVQIDTLDNCPYKLTI